jgi:hypothetical protein
MKKLILLLALCLVVTLTARAQVTTETILVNATFAETSDPTGPYLLLPAPTFSLNGQFTVNENTGVVSNWTLTLTGAGGATGTMSSLNGGIAQQICQYPSCLGDNLFPGYLNFNFTQGTDNVSLYSLFGDFSSFSSAGEESPLCPVSVTQYGIGGPIVGTPPCPTNSTAAFDGQGGVVYGVTNSAETSGFLEIKNVAETPELPSWVLLIAGSSLFCVFELLRRRA